MTNLRILTHLIARPGRETDLRNLLLQFMQYRCQQVGCDSCEMLQHQVDSTHFILVEEWDIEARLRSDFNSQVLERLFEEGAELIVEPPQIDWYNVTMVLKHAQNQQNQSGSNQG